VKSEAFYFKEYYGEDKFWKWFTLKVTRGKLVTDKKLETLI